MGDLRDHWEEVYAAKAETAVSWYQPHSLKSLTFIAAAADTKAPIVDVGGGASTLVDDLVGRGYSDVTVLDMAEAALTRSKARLGAWAAGVSWIVADITRWVPARRYRVWHDRAVFHFLTGRDAQDAYIAALEAGTEAGTTVIMATFAEDGPERCSGLAVQRYSPQSLAARLGSSFLLTDHALEAHVTPWGAKQSFSYAVFRRR